MKANILIFSIVIGVVFPMYSQKYISSATNMFRSNDSIIKQQVEYKNPGKIGKNVFWNFGDLKTIDDRYPILYSSDDTTSIITGIEHQTRYFYQLRNDSLLLVGYENPTTKITYNKPETMLRFPMKYGDEIEGYFKGEGTYCDKLKVLTYGKSTSEVDSYGALIIPSGDTLYNVIRVCTRKLILEKIITLVPDSVSKTEKEQEVITLSTIKKHLKTDSIVLAVNTYRWYAPGHRYPVFETIHTGNCNSKNKTIYFTTAFFYPPNKHSYLKTDNNNKGILEELSKAQFVDLHNDNDVNLKQKEQQEKIIFTYNIYPNPVKSNLVFEFLLSEKAKVAYELYNVAGATVYRKPSYKLNNGVYNDIINMENLTIGEYILRIQVNNKVYSEKIFKN